LLTSAPLIRVAVRVLRVVPVGVVRALARGAGVMAYWGATDRRRTILGNVSRLAAGESEAGQRRLARRTFVNLLEASVDLFRLPTASRAELFRLVEIEGREHLDAALALGKGVIAVTPHLGPYELGGAILAAAGYRVHAMVEDIDPDTNAALALYRQATGMQLISRSRGVRTVLRALKDGEIVLLVADRVVGDGSEGIELPFAGGVRAVPTGPASFALATGAPLIVGHIARNPSKASRYLIRLEPPILPQSTGSPADDRLRLTSRIAERLASVVREHPDQWFVFQPEWKRRDD
jgi:lauroyl/myristoyl acyltransferase